MSKKYNRETLLPLNTIFLTLTPIVAILSTYYWITLEGFDYRQLLLAIFFYILTGISITAGYHRLFSHRAYNAHPLVKLFFLCFGAAAFQNSVLKWGSDHRLHHNKVDTDQDPYNINEGFLYAHVGWVLLKENADIKERYARDLYADKLVMWQHKYIYLIGAFFGAVLPTLLGGLLFDSYLGGFALGAMGKIVILHHCTFFINSLCHYWGAKTYTDTNTARDSWYMALLTFGEGYHNFHHYFQADYRNGVRWFDFDPAKWLIKFMEWVGLANKLKVTPKVKILQARMQMKMKKVAKKRQLAHDKMAELELLKENTLNSLVKMQEIRLQFKQLKRNFKMMKLENFQVNIDMNIDVNIEDFKFNLDDLKDKLKEAKKEFKLSWNQWRFALQSIDMATA